MKKSNSISQRAAALQPSLTLEISALANTLKKEGKNICSLSAGEPDFNTPEYIVEAAVKALKDGLTRYGPAAGDDELREAVANKITSINNMPTQRENVVITNGGKQAIFNLFQVILNPGDEVIIPSPYWLSYPEMTRLAGAVPIFISSAPENGFKLNIKELESKITNKTKLLIINSPSNPTGRVIEKSELISIAELMRKHSQISIMSDEIYEFLISPKAKHISIGEVAPDLIDRIFIVNGFAKAWAMTGWRVGYLSGNVEVIKKAIALQSQSTSNVCTFAQRGALAAVNGPKETVLEMAKSYNLRRSLLTDGLNSIKNISMSTQEGAFYAFPKLPLQAKDSISFCKEALEKYGLAIVPGLAFGEDQCVRLSCAVSIDTINDGISRLKKLLNSI